MVSMYIRLLGRVSVFAGLEYGMERWNGNWTGRLNVTGVACSRSHYSVADLGGVRGVQMHPPFGG